MQVLWKQTRKTPRQMSSIREKMFELQKDEPLHNPVSTQHKSQRYGNRR